MGINYRSRVDMVPPDFAELDKDEISRNSFFPRENLKPVPDGAELHLVDVEDEVSLSCRFFPVDKSSPTILFFYGNGETSADYDEIAPIYNRIGVNFFISDYRGYGNSGGSPSYTAMLSDSTKVLRSLTQLIKDDGYLDHIYVMGRSMGRHSAFDLAASVDADLKGLIIESGRPSLGQFIYGFVPSKMEQFEEAYRAKVRSIRIPVLIIHGEVDALAPVSDAHDMFESFPNQNKHILVIKGAGHNNLMHVGLEEYFEAVRTFVWNGTEV